jgi:two-component system response regulator HydG
LAKEGKVSDSKASILIADDEMGMRETLLDILEDMGYHVTMAVDGYDAIQKVKQHTFDIIFMDVRMPGLDGVDAFKEIKKIQPGAAVVLITAYAVDDRIRDALREGAYRVLGKPLDLQMMIDLVEDVKLGGHILVVDDDPHIHVTFKQILETRGHTVRIARSGEEAIRIARENTYDMVFIEMKLSVMDGLETYLTLRRINPRTVAVMMTAYPRAASDFVIEALKENAYTCLYKPFGEEEVIRLVDRIRHRK